MPRRRQPAMGIGVLLLANEIFGRGIQYIPPVTLLFVLGQAALFVGIINPPWDRYEVCISGESILYYKDYWRLFLSAIEHADDLHLYHNMVSLILKGRTLERRHGSLRFLILLLVFIFSTSGMYVALAKALYMYSDEYHYMRDCAIGFSGVLFALKVLTTYESGERAQWIHGFVVPTKYAVWLELVIIHILVPRASFVGHLAGILVGILYMKGFLKVVVESLHHILSTILFSPSRHPRNSYTYSHGRPSYGDDTDYEHNNGYGWNEQTFENSFDQEEIRRRRMQRFM